MPDSLPATRPDNLTLRHFQDEGDYARLAAIITASQKADNLNLTVKAEDLVNNWGLASGFMLLEDLIIAEIDGQAAGFASVRWDDGPPQRNYKLRGHILPEQRRKGIGRALLSWMEKRALGLAEKFPTNAPSFLHINATQYQVGLHALARQAGYGIKESWVLMVRPSLEELPEARLPEGLEVRPAKPEHFNHIWHAVEEAYVPGGGPPPTGVFPPELMNDPNFQPELWQVAWEVSSGKVVGSVMTYINHMENKGMGILRGYTEGISTVPAWQQRGVAKALIARSLRCQREQGMTESGLVCNGEKLNNYKLYESCGFREVKRDTVYVKALSEVK